MKDRYMWPDSSVVLGYLGSIGYGGPLCARSFRAAVRALTRLITVAEKAAASHREVSGEAERVIDYATMVIRMLSGYIDRGVCGEGGIIAPRTPNVSAVLEAAGRLADRLIVLDDYKYALEVMFLARYAYLMAMYPFAAEAAERIARRRRRGVIGSLEDVFKGGR